MKKVILAPDSFKGTMSSIKICNIMEEVINKHFPDIHSVKIPVADGGEGTVESFIEALGGSIVKVPVSGPFFDKINSFYGILPDRTTAIIEMAAAAGLPLAGDKKDPMITTTYGVGELIKHAVIDNRCRKIIIGLGGSSTTDGGTGMASALGVKFYDERNEEFIPVGGTLEKISRIDMSGLLKEIKDCTILAMCDVDNPLYGKTGAAYVFGPQKGATEETVRLLDKGLEHLADRLKKQLDIDVAQKPGAGAAGGLGAGILAFLGGSLESGIETVLDTVKFDTLLNDANLVFTGEGKIDGQSLRGKVVVGIARRAKKQNVPVIAVVGDIGDDIDGIYETGVSAIVSINRVAVPFSIAAARSESDLKETMDTIMRLLKLTL
ncbi:MAG TPA: glycerate kinase [Ruminiclostridium sp.]|jgi:glycerate kinase|nr:glycerate kinase [Ruminiclostridium sp.]